MKLEMEMLDVVGQMVVYDLTSASDFLTGNLEIPGFFVKMLNVFLSTFFQMLEAV